MSDRQAYVLVNDRVRANAAAALRDAPDGYTMTLAPPTRSSDQNRKFHALVADIAASGVKFGGKPRDAETWKAVLISGHAVATGSAGEVLPGLEGEFVAIRESSARMSVKRAASLIEYTLAFCTMHGIDLQETRRGGWAVEEMA